MATERKAARGTGELGRSGCCKERRSSLQQDAAEMGLGVWDVWSRGGGGASGRTELR